MKDYVIITDATCDLPEEIVEELGIKVIPMEFELNGRVYQHYPDAREMKFRDFYERLRAGEMPKTSQINGVTYWRYFEPELQAGKDILYIAFSSGLSGTYQASLLASEDLKEKYPDSRIVCIDSLCACIGLGLLVYTAVQQKLKGATLDELADWILRNRCRVCHWFVVEDLNHLRKGGRISMAAAVAGTALGIKPVLHVDNEGHLVAVYKVRGRKKGMDTLLQQMEKTGENVRDQVIFVAHADCREDAKELRQMIKSSMHPKEIYMNYVGPIIGTHTGPGMLALVFFGTER